jgi:hypothetical protein
MRDPDDPGELIYKESPDKAIIKTTFFKKPIHHRGTENPEHLIFSLAGDTAKEKPSCVLRTSVVTMFIKG